jgi:uncharacterized membrane protein
MLLSYLRIYKVFVPLAVPLLLLDADLRKCFRSTGTLLKAFLIGSIGTLLGTLIAYSLGISIFTLMILLLTIIQQQCVCYRGFFKR